MYAHQGQNATLPQAGNSPSGPSKPRRYRHITKKFGNRYPNQNLERKDNAENKKETSIPIHEPQKQLVIAQISTQVKPDLTLPKPPSYFTEEKVKTRSEADKNRRWDSQQTRPFPSFYDRTLNGHIEDRIVLDDNHLPWSTKTDEESHWQTQRLTRSSSFDNDNGWHDSLMIGHRLTPEQMRRWRASDKARKQANKIANVNNKAALGGTDN